MSVSLSFIIPVRNDAARLRRCLDTTEAGAAHEVIVVDNGSTDGSADVARSAGARVLSLPGQRVSALRNAAAQVAAGDLLAFVDADHELGPGWAAAAERLFRDEPGTVAAGAPYHAPADGTWVQRMYDHLRTRHAGRRLTEWLPSGNLVVRRDAFQAVGGFDTSLETCEDVDLCQRLAAAGGRVVEFDELTSVHRGDPRTLRALFLGELWRGRDNLRVTLRGPLSFRSLPSILIPIGILVGLAGMTVGIALWPLVGWPVAAAGALLVVALVATRASVLLRRVSKGRPSGRAAVEALLVGGVYDVARACALVARPSHDLRKKG
jgi:hypothetical protein